VKRLNKEFWVIWKATNTRRRYTIAILKIINNKYYFEYNQAEINEAINMGFDFFPGFPEINKKYESEELFTNIATRLPNSTNIWIKPKQHTT
jgi:hypothetical protein